MSPQEAVQHTVMAGLILRQITQVWRVHRHLCQRKGFRFYIAFESRINQMAANSVAHHICSVIRASREEVDLHIRLGFSEVSSDFMDHISFVHDWNDTVLRSKAGDRYRTPFRDYNDAVSFENSILAPTGGSYDSQTVGIYTTSQYKTIGFEMLSAAVNQHLFNVHPDFFTLTAIDGIGPDDIIEKIKDQMMGCLRKKINDRMAASITNNGGDAALALKVAGSSLEGLPPGEGLRLAGYVYGKKVKPNFKDDLVTSFALSYWTFHTLHLSWLLQTPSSELPINTRSRL